MERAKTLRVRVYVVTHFLHTHGRTRTPGWVQHQSALHDKTQCAAVGAINQTSYN